MMGLAGSGKDTTAKILQDALLVAGHGHFDLRAFAAPLKDFAIDAFGFSPSAVYDHVLKEKAFTMSYDKSSFMETLYCCLDDIISDYCNSSERSYDEVMGVIAGKLGVERNGQVMYKLADKYLEVLADDTCKPSWLRTKLDWMCGEPKLVFKSTPRSILQKTGTEFFRGLVSESFWTDIAPKSGVIMTDVRFSNELDYIRNNGGVIIKIVNKNQRVIKNSTHASEELVYTATPDFTFVHDGVNIQSIVSNVDAFVNNL